MVVVVEAPTWTDDGGIDRWRKQVLDSVPLPAPDDWPLTGECETLYVHWKYKDTDTVFARRRVVSSLKAILWSKMPSGAGVGRLTIKFQAEDDVLRLGLAVVAEWSSPAPLLDTILEEAQ